MPRVSFRSLRRRWPTLLACLLGACGSGSGPAAPPDEVVHLHFLPLEPADAFDRAEFSSLCWWEDDLLLLPQFAGSAGQGIYVRSRDSIARAIRQVRAGQKPAALRPRVLEVESSGIPESIEGYDGLEAVVIRGEKCFLIAEYGSDSTAIWGSRLLIGKVQRAASRVSFEALGSTRLEGEQVRQNYTHESLVLADDELWVLPELHGTRISAAPQLARYALDLTPLGSMALPHLEYRISDATALDDEGRFWVLNLLWPPDATALGAPADSRSVERLVPLRHVGGRIERDLRQPVLDLRDDKHRVMRNWEGVARWDARSFLLVTDTYPGNILAFADRPE